MFFREQTDEVEL